MQGVILAIAKARQTFDRDGSEAGLIKVSLFFNFSCLYHRYHNNGAIILLDGKKKKMGLQISFIEGKHKTPFPVQLTNKPSHPAGCPSSVGTNASVVSRAVLCHTQPGALAVVFKKYLLISCD